MEKEKTREEMLKEVYDTLQSEEDVSAFNRALLPSEIAAHKVQEMLALSNKIRIYQQELTKVLVQENMKNISSVEIDKTNLELSKINFKLNNTYLELDDLLQNIRKTIKSGKYC